MSWFKNTTSSHHVFFDQFLSIVSSISWSCSAVFIFTAIFRDFFFFYFIQPLLYLSTSINQTSLKPSFTLCFLLNYGSLSCD
jgi:hypothetical protein